MTAPTQRKRRPQITVIGNSKASPAAVTLAERVGELLARLGCVVLSGGGTGIMEGVSRGASLAGGLTIGILPGDNLDGGNAWLDVVIPSGIGYARNSANVLAADMVIAIGGSSGTLSELAFAWLYEKPIIALTGAGGWSDRLAGDRIDDRRMDRIERADSVEELERILVHRLAALRPDAG